MMIVGRDFILMMVASEAADMTIAIVPERSIVGMSYRTDPLTSTESRPIACALHIPTPIAAAAPASHHIRVASDSVRERAAKLNPVKDANIATITESTTRLVSKLGAKLLPGGGLRVSHEGGKKAMFSPQNARACGGRVLYKVYRMLAPRTGEKPA
jgi:hypothetical protein